MANQLTPLTSRYLKAHLFSTLYQSELSGLHLHHAINILSEQKIIPIKHIVQFKNNIAHGNSVAHSGSKAMIFTPFECSLISAGESSGELTRIYKQLASFYQRQLTRRSQLKTKLALPVITIIVFIFIQPIQALILGYISIESYLLKTVGVIAQLLLGIVLIVSLPKWLTTPFAQSKGLTAGFYALQCATPLISGWIKQRTLNHFLTTLSLQLNAGINIEAALVNSIATIQNQLLKQQMSSAIKAVQQGNTLTSALLTTSLVDELTLQQINVGEQSGRLEQVLTNLSKSKNKTEIERDEQLYEWLPRLIYGFIVVSIAYTLLSGPSTLSH